MTTAPFTWTSQRESGTDDSSGFGVAKRASEHHLLRLLLLAPHAGTDCDSGLREAASGTIDTVNAKLTCSGSFPWLCSPTPEGIHSLLCLPCLLPHQIDPLSVPV